MRAAWLGFTAAALAASVAAGAGEPAKAKKPVVCGPGGVEVTVALAYDDRASGPIAATYMDLGFQAPLSLPQSPEELRPRLTSLLPQGDRVGPPKVEAGRLRVAVATTEQGIQPATAFKMRFDCSAGGRIERESLSCSTAEVVGASGQPMDEALARDVRCEVVGLDPVRR